MPEVKVKDHIDIGQRLKADRTDLNELWEEMAEVLAPERFGFTGKGMPQHRRHENIYDTSPLIAKRGLTNSIGAMLRPKSAAPGKWFDIVPEDEDLLKKPEEKKWVERVEERLWRGLYNPRAEFIHATGEIDDDIVTFGTGTGMVTETVDGRGMLYRAFHMKNVFLEVNDLNQPVGSYIYQEFTAKQAAIKFGEENLGEKTREALKNDREGKGTETKFMFLWVVRERYEIDPRIGNNLNMPVMSLFIDIESEHLVLEEGFEEYPFFHPRWDTRSGDIYGRGPGVLALPDVLTLNQMGKTMLRALHRAVDPTWLLPSDSMVTPPSMVPGDVAYYDAKAIRNLGLSDPFRQMDSRANIPWGLDAQATTREQIFSVFYKNVLNLPIDGPEMTATEVIQRREEFVREIGAVFGRLETDYTMPIVETTFQMMLRRGSFGAPEDIPESLQDTKIDFRFASPVEKAKRQIEEAGVMQGLDKVLSIGQIQPKIMTRFNWDAVGKFLAETSDFPAALTLDDKSVEEIHAQEAAKTNAAESMQAMGEATSAIGSLPPELLKGAVPPAA
jgi:hypothetical protein